MYSLHVPFDGCQVALRDAPDQLTIPVNWWYRAPHVVYTRVDLQFDPSIALTLTSTLDLRLWCSILLIALIMIICTLERVNRRLSLASPPSNAGFRVNGLKPIAFHTPILQSPLLSNANCTPCPIDFI